MRPSKIHIEAVGGVAGDMLLAALIDVLGDAAPVRRAIDSLAIPSLQLQIAEVELGDERALHVRSIAPSLHGAGEHHHHHLSDVFALLDRAQVSTNALAIARRIFTRLGEAEAAVHGGTVDDVHLHEVGELDSVLDVLGIAVAIDALGSPPVGCTALPSGRGTVDTSHGRLSCPVPAVVEIARTANVPLEEAELEGETVTPTGIAAVATLVSDGFGPVAPGAERVGRGAGTRRFASRPNLVRVHAWR